jgi:hypothetical protein
MNVRNLWAWFAAARTGVEGKEDPEVDLAEVNQMLVDLALSQVERQLASSDSYDTKATAILATATVFIAVVVATAHDWGPIWWVPIVGSMVSALVAVIALMPRDFDPGPNVAEFYSKHGDDKRIHATAQMISELQVSKGKNQRALTGKRQLFTAAVVALLATLLCSGVSFLIWK